MEFRFVDPTEDFSNGLAVLSTYHQKFRALGEQLLDLVAEVHAHGMSEARAYRCVQLHSELSRTNALHHQDEERALFPLIVNRSPLIDGMLERLTRDHEEIEAAWRDLGELLSRPEHLTDRKKLVTLAHTFEKLLREHVVREDEDFFPKLGLTAEQLAEAGKTMAKLRSPGSSARAV